MKLETPKLDIERRGVMKTIRCSIDIGASTFKMLARQYSDPPKAIIQEISSNALDSHTRAGKVDIPIKVDLPTRLDPHLRIRDYGIGMSPEKIKDVYSVYMKSDKRDSNNEIGAFGLGSKVILSYTDQFNITTYNDGVMRMYTMGYGSDSVPELAQLGEYPTKEENGVEISFAVKDGDAQLFKDAASKVFPFFATLPIVNDREFKCDVKKRLVEGEGWYLTGDRYDSHVVMGGIAYKIDQDIFGRNYRYNCSVGEDLLGIGIHIDIPIGSVDVVPSREHLEFNDKTKDYIKSRLIAIGDVVVGKVEAELEACDSNISRMKKFLSLDGPLRSISRSINSALKSTTVNLGTEYLYKYFPIIQGSKRVNPTLNRSIKYHNKLRLVLVNNDEKFEKKVRYNCRQNDLAYYVIRRRKPNKKALMKQIGATEADGFVLMLDELEDVPKIAGSGRRTGPRKTTRSIKVFMPKGDSKDRNGVYNSKWWESQEIDVKTEQIYIKMCAYNVYGRFYDILDLLPSLGISPPQVLGLTSANQKLVDKKNFIEFKDWLKTKIDAECPHTDIKNRVENELVADHIDDYISIDHLKNMFKNATIPINNANSPFNVLKKYIPIGKEDNKLRDWCKLLEISTNSQPSTPMPINKEVTEAIDTIESKYKIIPKFLKELSSYHERAETFNSIIETINIFDKQYLEN